MIWERKLNFDAVNNIQMLNFNLSNLLSTDLHMEMLRSINLPSLPHGVPISSNSSQEGNNLEEETEARGSFYAVTQFIANIRLKINLFQTFSI